MQKEVQANRLPDLTLSTQAAVVTPAQLAAWSGCRTCRASQARQLLPDPRLDRRAARQGARHRRPRLRATSRSTSSRVASGAATERGQRAHATSRTPSKAATPARRRHDRGSSASAAGPDAAGQRASAATSSAARRRATADVVVLYSTAGTVARLGAEPGFSSLELRLADASAAGRRTTVAARRATTCARTPGFTGFSDLPAVREPGDYPGKDVLRPDRVADERVHGAGAALGAGADREHDDDARRRAAPRDRDDEGDRRRAAARSAAIYLRTALLLGAARLGRRRRARAS